jgi:hypothetical protein
MATTHTITRVGTQSRTRQATLLTAIVALAAVAISIAVLTLAGAHHSTAATPLTTSNAAAGSVPQVRYLGPNQVSEDLNAVRNLTPSAGADDAAHYICLGVAQERCLR